MVRVSRPGTCSIVRTGVALGALIGVLAPSLVGAAVIEGMSGSGSEDVIIRYRCESLDCEFEAVVDDRLRDDIIEYEWRLGDGRTVTTDVATLVHRWAEPGSQLVNVSVHDRYCDLYVAEASFLTSVPAVGGSYNLIPASIRLGQDARRVASEPLQGMTVRGDVFIFVESLRGAGSVAFSLSGPGFDDRALRVEKVAPFDLAGGAVDSASPFDTRGLDDGAYRLDVQASYEDGSVETVSVDFEIRNGGGEIAGTLPDGDLDDAVADGSDSVPDDAEEPTVGAAVPDEPSPPADGPAADGLDEDVGADEPTPPAEPVPPADIDALTRAAVLLGQNAERDASVPLQGAVVDGDAFVYIEALPDVSRVAFRLAGPGFDARTLRIEKVAPFDLAGGSVGAANPFDTRELTDGTYRLEVLASYQDGSTESVSVDFEVRNHAGGPMAGISSEEGESNEVAEPDTGAALPGAPDVIDGSLVFSTRSNRARSGTLAGATVEGRVYVHLEGAQDASAVRFFLDDPTRRGEPLTVEENAPWDAMGGSKKRARPLDTRGLSNGRHTLSAEIIVAGRSVVVHGSFTVAN